MSTRHGGLPPTLEAWELVKDCVIEGRPLKDLWQSGIRIDVRGCYKIFYAMFQDFAGFSNIFQDVPRIFGAFCRVSEDSLSEDSPGLIYDFLV